MALVTRASTCCFCGMALGRAEIVAFPPFVPLRDDPLSHFSDAVAHRDCFERCSTRGGVERVLAALRAASDGTAVCAVCEQPVSRRTPGAFHSGYLGSTGCGQRFGLLSFHAHCYTSWSSRVELESCLADIVNAGTWRGGSLVLRPAPRWGPARRTRP